MAGRRLVGGDRGEGRGRVARPDEELLKGRARNLTCLEADGLKRAHAEGLRHPPRKGGVSEADLEQLSRGRDGHQSQR